MDSDIENTPALDGPGTSLFDEYDHSNFYYSAGDDPLSILGPFAAWYRDAYPKGYYLYQEPLVTAPATRITLKNSKTGELQDLINLASYNYLGLSYRPEVKEAAIKAIHKYGIGAAGSPILSGTFDVHKQLEERIAAFKRQPAAVLFSTGYGTNVGFIAAIMRAGDSIFLDQYAHASLVDGALLAKSNMVFFRHNDPADLERKLGRARGKKLVVVEGIYSMDGDLCALPEIVSVAQRHGARILIDEAHSNYVFGAHGRGVAEHFGLEEAVDFHIGTFSKALGSQGGYVCVGHDLADYTHFFSRSRLFSCNLAPASAAASIAALNIVASEPQLRARLWSNVSYLRGRCAEEGIDIGKSASQIMPIMINNDRKIFAVAEKLQARGVYLNPVTYPAVPKHKSRLRVSVSSTHTHEELATAVQIIGAVLREEGICRT